MTKVKPPYVISRMRYSGSQLRILLDLLKAHIHVGQTGVGLNKIAEHFFAEHDVSSNFYGYENFSAYICVSVNEHLIHGIPNAKPFQKGDLVSVDAGCVYRSYHSDAAFTQIVGEPNCQQDQQLVATTYDALHEAAKLLVPKVTVGTIGAFIGDFVQQAGFYCPKNYAGHGIGTKMHEAPLLFNYGIKNQGVKLKLHQTVCLEPMVQIGTAETVTLSDGWTVMNANKQNSAHFEATLLVTAHGGEHLT